MGVTDAPGLIKANAYDLNAIRRLDRDFQQRRLRYGANAACEYSDSTEYTEDWAGTTNVLKATNGQVSGNKFYATNATAPGGWNKAYSLSLAAGARWRLSTLLYYKASGGASTYFGINCGVSGKALAAGDPDSIVIGLTSGNVRSVSLGSNLSAVNLLNQGSLGSGPSGADKVYLVTIEADDEDISFTIKGIGTIDDEVIWSIEKAGLTALGKTINNLTCYITDSRGTSGNAFGPFIVQTDSIQQPRTKVLGGQTIHGQDFIQRRTSTGNTAAGNAFVTTLPKNYDARKPHPLVIWHHQSVTGSAWDMFEESRVQPVTQALLDAGYILAGCNDPLAGSSGNSFGNQTQLDKYLALYEFMIKHYNIGPWFGYGASMGGLSLANTISKRVMPTPAACAVVGGAYDQGHAYDLGPPFDALQLTAFAAANRAALITNSTGYDPIRNKTLDFRGVPWRFYTSAADPYQPTAQQNAMAAIVSPGAPEAGVVVASGGHLDASQYQASDVLAFFRRYGGS